MGNNVQVRLPVGPEFFAVVSLIEANARNLREAASEALREDARSRIPNLSIANEGTLAKIDDLAKRNGHAPHVADASQQQAAANAKQMQQVAINSVQELVDLTTEFRRMIGLQ